MQRRLEPFGDILTVALAIAIGRVWQLSHWSSDDWVAIGGP